MRLHRVEGAGADHVEDRERRQVDDAGPVAHREVLGVDDRRPPAGVPLVLARHHPVAVLARAGRRWTAYQNGRSQPTASKNRRPSSTWRACIGASRWLRSTRPLLAGVHDAVGLVERLAGARLRRARGCAGAGRSGRCRSADRSISGSPSVIHSATARPTPGPLLDPDRRGRPQPLDLGGLAEDRRAVGGQREQPVDRVPDLRALGAEQRPASARRPARAAGRSRRR